MEAAHSPIRPFSKVTCYDEKLGRGPHEARPYVTGRGGTSGG